MKKAAINSVKEIIIRAFGFVSTKVAYTVYTLLVTLLFLYFQFPGDSVVRFVEQKVKSLSSEIEVTSESVSPIFTAGLKLHNTDVRYNDKEILHSDKISVKLSLLKLFVLKPVIRIAADIYGGDIKINLSLAELKKQKFLSEFKVSDIKIQNTALKDFLQGNSVSGLIEGTGDFDINRGNLRNLNGKISLKNAIVKLDKPVFTIDTFDNGNIEADIQYKNQKITIKKAEISCRQAQGSFTGNVRIRRPFEKSIINLKGNIKPDPDFLASLGSNLPLKMFTSGKYAKSGIPVTIRGTVGSPGYSLR